MTVDPNIQQKADYIRTRKQGSKVRESLASGLEAMSSDVVENKNRQNAVEEQFQDVIENTTGKDVISAPEIIAARNGEPNLKSRLDKEHQQVTAQLAQKANQEFVNQQIANVASGTPKGAFETLQQLQYAYPSGTTGIFVITTDGKWYYWNNSSWVAGGIYQSTLWQNALTTQNQPWEVL